MKRAKQVYNSHSQLSHVWAQQTQLSGRAGNMFFDEEGIYSYGYHYKAARIHTVKGHRFALVNSHRYSISTGKHLSEIGSALDGLMPYFESPDVNDPKAAVKYLDQLAQNQITKALKRIKIQSQEDINTQFEYIRNGFVHTNALRKLLGRAEVWPKQNQLNAVQAHLAKRLARYNELNPPEVLAERKRIKDAEIAEKQRLIKIHLASDIEAFRQGEMPWGLYQLDHDLLRIDGTTLKTSRGAEVPLTDAIGLYQALKSGKNFSSQIGKVGEFTFQSIDRTLEDPVIQVGCHRILMSEADKVLGALWAK